MSEEELEAALSGAEADFWVAIAEHFPSLSCDAPLDPEITLALQAAMRAAAVAWIESPRDTP